MYYVSDTEMKELLIIVVANTSLIGLITCVIGVFFARILKQKNKDDSEISLVNTISVVSMVGIFIAIGSLVFLFFKLLD